MRKLFLTGILKITFALIFIGAIFATKAPAQLGELLNRIDARSNALTSLKATIRMASYDPVLKETTPRDGVLMFISKSKKQKNHLFRLDWQDATGSVSLIDGKFEVYNPKTNIVQTGAANAKKAEQHGGGILSFLRMSKKELQENYRPEMIGSETLNGGIITGHIKFIPKTASKYKFVEIWADKDGIVHQARTSPKSGDDVMYRLTNIQDNPTLDPRSFEIKKLPGAKVVPV
jgi:outer membrane lipoprotein-sorting protein